MLDEHLADWIDEPAIGFDTEFVRTRTFYARLGLIQVSDSRGVYLIDCVAIQDLSGVGELFRERRGDSVLHSCSEDLGIFHHRFGGALPRAVFDTQIAAALVGLGFSLAYQRLVEDVIGVHLDKGETRSNWMARPLSSSQLRYAAADVHHLLPLRERLLDKLDRLGRESWAREEFDRLLDASRYTVEAEEAYLRIRGGGSLDRRRLGVLRDLASWREGEAKREDRARGFVIRDASLLDLARRLPASERDLRGIRELHGSQRRRYGDRLLGLVADALDAPEAELPARDRQPRVRRQKELVRKLQDFVARSGLRLGVAPEILASKGVLLKLTRRVVAEGNRELPAELTGWRREVIGEPMLELLEST